MLNKLEFWQFHVCRCILPHLRVLSCLETLIDHVMFLKGLIGTQTCYIHQLIGTLMYIACLCPNLVSVHFYAIPILHFKFPFTCKEPGWSTCSSTCVYESEHAPSAFQM